MSDQKTLEYLIESMDPPPDTNCSCHINPPCYDCADYGAIREAYEEACTIVEATRGAAPTKPAPRARTRRRLDL